MKSCEVLSASMSAQGIGRYELDGNGGVIGLKPEFQHTTHQCERADDTGEQVMKHYLFLDVDGVLHPLNEKHLPSLVDPKDLLQRVDEEEKAGDALEVVRVLSGEFHPPILSCLAKVLNDTAAKVDVILSSTWRQTLPGRRAVEGQLSAAALPALSGCTPMLWAARRCRRCHEILEFLVDHHRPRGTPFRFCVLDDDDLCEGDEEDHAASFVRPHFVRCQKSEGLTEEDAARALSTLGDEGPTAHLTDDVVSRVEADRRARRAEEEEDGEM